MFIVCCSFSQLVLSSMPGPPLTEKSSILELVEHGVSVGLGVTQNWAAQNTRFDLAWV